MTRFLDFLVDMSLPMLLLLGSVAVFVQASQSARSSASAKGRTWWALLLLVAFLAVGCMVVLFRVSAGLVAIVVAALGALAVGNLLLASRRRAPGLVAMSLAWGVVMVLGAVWQARLVAAQSDPGMKALLIPLAATLIMSLFSWSRRRRWVDRIPALMLLGLGLALIAAPLVLGERTNGAAIGLRLPLLGVVQTGELGRLMVLLWLAKAVAHYQAPLIVAGSRLSKLNLRLLAVLALPVLVGVVLGSMSNDFGPVLVLSFATLAVVVAGGLGRRLILWVFGLSLLGVAGLVATNAKVRGRVTDMLFAIPADRDVTQVGHGLILMAHGPAGLGMGLPNLVPLAVSDMQLSAIAHEMGVLIFVPLLLAWGSVIVSTRVVIAHLTDNRAQLTVVALTTVLVAQSMYMLASVLSIAPLTGVPVPFLAYSGSSMITSYLTLGLIVSVTGAAGVLTPSTTAVKRYKVLGLAGLVLAVILLLRTCFVMVTPWATLGAANGRDLYAARSALLSVPALVTSDGVVIAQTVAKDPHLPLRLANAVRAYPQGAEYAALLGTPVRPGLDAAIAASQDCRRFNETRLDACGEVTTTLLASVQDVAWKAMSGKTGAAVALDTRTGAVLAYVSTLEGSDVDPRDRVRSETIAPGSSAKILTAGVALETRANLALPVTDKYDVSGGGTITAGHGACGGNLDSALAVSCNPYFAALGSKLGGAQLGGASEAWLNNQTHISGMTIARSALVRAGASDYMVAAGAIGLGDAQVTPLGMLGYVAQIARGGAPVCMQLVSHKAGCGEDQTEMTHDTATHLTSAMRTVVTEGTARRVPGLSAVNAAAKTGTADISAANNATFVAFAPYSTPKVAVVVFLQPGPRAQVGLAGNKDAGPIAAAILAQALKALPN